MTLSLSWHVQNFIVIRWTHYEQQHCAITLHFEFIQYPINGTGARSNDTQLSIHPPCVWNEVTAIALINQNSITSYKSLTMLHWNEDHDNGISPPHHKYTCVMISMPKLEIGFHSNITISLHMKCQGYHISCCKSPYCDRKEYLVNISFAHLSSFLKSPLFSFYNLLPLCLWHQLDIAKELMETKPAVGILLPNKSLLFIWHQTNQDSRYQCLA